MIEKGVVWEYNNTEDQESLVTTGPLKYGVLLMVSPPESPVRVRPEGKPEPTPTHPVCALSGPFPRRLQGDSLLQVHHPGLPSVLAGVQLGAGGRHLLRVGPEEVVSLLQALWRR